MDLSKQPLFRMLREKMDYLGQREKVLAQNVANANTPHYQARDLKPINFKDEMQHQVLQVTPVMTQPNHLPPVTPVGQFKVETVRKPYETSLDGNGVVLEEQAMKIAQTQADYQAASAMYRKYLSMIKFVVSR